MKRKFGISRKKQARLFSVDEHTLSYRVVDEPIQPTKKSKTVYDFHLKQQLKLHTKTEAELKKNNYVILWNKLCRKLEITNVEYSKICMENVDRLYINPWKPMGSEWVDEKFDCPCSKRQINKQCHYVWKEKPDVKLDVGSSCARYFINDPNIKRALDAGVKLSNDGITGRIVSFVNGTIIAAVNSVKGDASLYKYRNSIQLVYGQSPLNITTMMLTIDVPRDLQLGSNVTKNRDFTFKCNLVYDEDECRLRAVLKRYEEVPRDPLELEWDDEYMDYSQTDAGNKPMRLVVKNGRVYLRFPGSYNYNGLIFSIFPSAYKTMENEYDLLAVYQQEFHSLVENVELLRGKIKQWIHADILYSEKEYIETKKQAEQKYKDDLAYAARKKAVKKQSLREVLTHFK